MSAVLGLTSTLTHLYPRDRLAEPLPRPELIVGLVGALGTDMSAVSQALDRGFSLVGYSTLHVRLSRLLEQFSAWKPTEEGEFGRLSHAIELGDQVRESAQRGDALALLGITAIRKHRSVMQRAPGDQALLASTAFVIRSLKHPDEVQTLRGIYGSRFILLGAYASRKARVLNTARRIAESLNSTDIDSQRDKAERLVHIDQEESGRPLGQRLRDTYPLADVFVDTSHPQQMDEATERFMRLFFAHPFVTPSRDEYGMFHAKAAALRSAALGRQVGAVIATQEGEVVAVGTNEVPKAGGGLYWDGDDGDARDFQLGEDSIDSYKKRMLCEVLDHLKKEALLVEGQPDAQELATRLLAKKGALPGLRGAQFMNVLEYGRVVHAEMAAIVEAARRGTSVKGCVLYTTTFPCHNCARHIVAAGISRVVYIEPYPKSLASQLHMDALDVEGDTSKGARVALESFVGISPSRYLQFFDMPKRKEESGKICIWRPLEAFPRGVDAADGTYPQKELIAIGAYSPRDSRFEKEVQG